MISGRPKIFDVLGSARPRRPPNPFHLGRVAASIQLDVSKMFDRICHRVLVLPEVVVGEPIRPRCGVVPGSPFAVFEVAALLLEYVLDFYRCSGGHGLGRGALVFRASGRLQCYSNLRLVTHFKF